VKEEVVESCILDEDTVVEMTLSSPYPAYPPFSRLIHLEKNILKFAG